MENDFRLQKQLQKAQEKYQQKSYFQALQEFEKLKYSLQQNELDGTKSMVIIQKNITEICNIIGLSYLNKKKFEQSLEFLKKAEVNARQSKQCLFMTLNNIACYYKEVGKHRVALGYLQESLIEEKKNKNIQNVAELFLNICAVLSQIKKHQEAYQAAQNALCLIQEIMLKESLDSFNLKKKYSQELNQSTEQYQKQISEKYLQTLIVTYYNMAVELEHLKQLEDSLDFYIKAREFIKYINLEQNNCVFLIERNIEDAVKQVNRKINEEIKRKKGREKQRKMSMIKAQQKQENFVQEKVKGKIRPETFVQKNNIEKEIKINSLKDFKKYRIQSGIMSQMKYKQEQSKESINKQLSQQEQILFDSQSSIQDSNHLNSEDQNSVQQMSSSKKDHRYQENISMEEEDLNITQISF